MMKGTESDITARKDVPVLMMQWAMRSGHGSVTWTVRKTEKKVQVEECSIFLSITPSTSVVFSGGGALIGDTAPEGAPDGSIWWNSADGPSAAKRLYVKYFDGNSSQWVAAEQ